MCSFGQSSATRTPFPLKLYNLLEAAEEENFDHVVSWNETGDGFKVHNSAAFVQNIAPKYFAISKYKSFQRQLSLYNFGRVTTGEKKGLRFHNMFVRGRKDAVAALKPLAAPIKKSKSAKKEQKSLASSAVASEVQSTGNGSVLVDGALMAPSVFIESYGSPNGSSFHFSSVTAMKNSPIPSSSGGLGPELREPTIPPPISPSRDDVYVPSFQEENQEDLGFFEGMNFFLVEDLESSQQNHVQPRMVSPSRPSPVADFKPLPQRPTLVNALPLHQPEPDDIFQCNLNQYFENTRSFDRVVSNEAIHQEGFSDYSQPTVL